MNPSVNRDRIPAEGNAPADANLPAHITDAQVHIWLPGGERKPSASGRQEPFSAEELLAEMDAAGVERAVIVTPSWNRDGNAYPLASAQKYPARLRVMGLSGIPRPEDQAAYEAWMAPEGMVGLRMFLASPPGQEWLASGAGDWFWPILEARGIRLMVQAGESLGALKAIAGKHPGLKMCLDAFGLPLRVHGHEAAAAFDAVTELAAFPNVMMKTAAIPYISEDPFPYADMQEVLRRAYDSFGPDRLFYASDITLLKVPYAESLRFWTAPDFLTDEDRAKIMGGNINAWLDWSRI